MNQESYFAQLRQEFQNDPYRERFLQELEDHAEDLQGDIVPSNKSLTTDFMKKHFGEPKQVKKDFMAITRPWQKWLEAGEAFLYGILMVFWIGASGVLEFISYYLVPFLFS